MVPGVWVWVRMSAAVARRFSLRSAVGVPILRRALQRTIWVTIMEQGNAYPLCELYF